MKSVTKPMHRIYLLALSIVLLAVMFSPPSLFGQAGPNIITNPSFENYLQIPQQRPVFNGFVSDWYSTNTCCVQLPPNCQIGPVCITPDYFHALCPIPCNGGGVGVPLNVMGNQNPKHGQAYAGIVTTAQQTPLNACQPPFAVNPNHVEYITVPLTQPMVVGETYNVGMWVNLAEISQYAAGDLGMVFTTLDPVFNDCQMAGPLPFGVNPPNIASAPISVNAPITDYDNWFLVSGEIVANAAYSYVTIGRFGAVNLQNLGVQAHCGVGSSPFAYYYVDAVYASQKLCSCDALTATILNGDADLSCCRYFRFDVNGNSLGTGCEPFGSAGSISRIRVTSCTPGVKLQLNLHYPPNQQNTLDRYRIIDGDTYEYVGTNNTPQPVPNTTPPNLLDRIPGFFCLVDPDDPDRRLCGAIGNVCLKFQFLDAAGNIICEKVVTENFNCAPCDQPGGGSGGGGGGQG